MNEYHFTVQQGKRVSSDFIIMKGMKSCVRAEKKALLIAQGKYPSAKVHLSRVFPLNVKR